MIRLSPISQLLLPAQVRCTGSFHVKFAGHRHAPGHQPPNATLQVHQEANQVRCHLRAGLDFHTLNLPTIPADKLTARIKEWIEDCANGRLEGAA
ncbi:hypothetical protein [Halopseudomonas salina]|uniref:Uncharacterized protein n=1 Tax=Halopseudomonas salina TaxID=1323744 RepID=A0ABQ1NY79_9GAMM|nr:hypothetical protein [Halopseudomonas salina]GGC87221.1 hypothetical protein GCM10007418_03750 [Halopseudomonas salina]